MSLINEALKKAEESKKKPDPLWNPIKRERRGSRKKYYLIAAAGALLIVAVIALKAFLFKGSPAIEQEPPPVVMEEKADEGTKAPASALLGKPAGNSSEGGTREPAKPSETGDIRKTRKIRTEKINPTRKRPLPAKEKELPAAKNGEAERYFRFAIAKERAGEIALAMDAYRKALLLNPDHEQARLNLSALLIDRGLYKEAVKVLSGIRKGDENPKVLFNLALANYGAGNLKVAIEYARRSLAISPDNFRAYLLLGDITDATGNREAALANYRKAAALAPDSPEVLYKLGRELDLLGNRKDAIACYRAFLNKSRDREKRTLVLRRLAYLQQGGK